jgi:hypothetical protein
MIENIVQMRNCAFLLYIHKFTKPHYDIVQQIHVLKSLFNHNVYHEVAYPL